jgi:hypothetical protein
MQYEAPNQQQPTEEDIASMSQIDQILARMVKTPHVQQFLEAVRDAIIYDRAHQKLNFKPEFMYEAAAASGYSHGQLVLITQLCSLGHVTAE